MPEVKSAALNEVQEQRSEINAPAVLKPEDNVKMQECRNFFDELFRSEISDEESEISIADETYEESKGSMKEKMREGIVEETAKEDKPEKKGGSYGEVFKEGEGETYEVHHMPADSASHLERNDGPAIKMEKEDHRKTASCGSSREAREYRDVQKELVDKGKFREALQMDIDDIREKFGDKYDDAIAEMLVYINKLEAEGKINA